VIASSNFLLPNKITAKKHFIVNSSFPALIMGEVAAYVVKVL
jgi:hypothetical protein